jgi:hypothetical protein
MIIDVCQTKKIGSAECVLVGSTEYLFGFDFVSIRPLQSSSLFLKRLLGSPELIVRNSDNRHHLVRIQR